MFIDSGKITLHGAKNHLSRQPEKN